MIDHLDKNIRKNVSNAKEKPAAYIYIEVISWVDLYTIFIHVKTKIKVTFY